MGMLYINDKKIEYKPIPKCNNCYGRGYYIRFAYGKSTLKPCPCVRLTIKEDKDDSDK